jgi:hypothetical protein
MEAQTLTLTSVLHSVLVLFQATTLNVAINSNNKALLTIMMSNNVSSVLVGRWSVALMML